MRQAGSRKATPEIPVPGDARGSPPSLQRAVLGGHVARRMGGGGRIRRAGTQGMEQAGTGLNSAPPAAAPALRVGSLAASRTGLSGGSGGRRLLAPWSSVTFCLKTLGPGLWRIAVGQEAHGAAARPLPSGPRSQRCCDSASASWEPHCNHGGETSQNSIKNRFPNLELPKCQNALR